MDNSPQAPLSIGFSRKEYWSGLPFLSPGDLSDPGIQPASPALAGVSLPSEPPGNSRHILLVKQSQRPDSKGGNVNSYTLIGVQGSYYAPGCCCCYLVTQLCLTLCDPWTVACQAPLSVGFCRQEYWSGLPFPPPGDLPEPGIEPASSALAGKFFTTEPPGKLKCCITLFYMDLHA